MIKGLILACALQGFGIHAQKGKENTGENGSTDITVCKCSGQSDVECDARSSEQGGGGDSGGGDSGGGAIDD